ncbi:hypothetical protein PLEOSDRAFT_1100572 [Pleurotus ostreatus PC15]|uniref:Uncharacterized protein n=1 Tax=Pleurotus ostreatus (strain PC15) TaxID=1137138 RepID=A0A067NYK0_PLEO1|nr:hypothetical protein PLEOSDRAFT_1100572 [Pleurotus ostreatus PC15]
MAHNPHSRRRPLSTAFFPPTAKLPLDPFAHMAPATWDVHVSSLKSLESAMQNVVLIVGVIYDPIHLRWHIGRRPHLDPEPLSLRPVLSSPVLSQSLVILISHNPPSVDDIHNALQQSPTPGVQYPTLYLVKIATPAILLGALRLVRVLERAQVLARAWRKNTTAFAFAERTRRYHYAKGHAAQPSTASGSSSASHSPPPPSSIIRIVLFAEQPPLDSSEFIPVNEYGIEIVPAASSRSSTLFNGWLGGRRQRHNSGIYGIHTQGGSEVVMSKPNTSKLSLALSLPVRMPRMGRRLSKMGAPSSDRPMTSPTSLPSQKHDPTHRPFDVVMSFLPPPETRYTVASSTPTTSSTLSLPFRKTPKSGSQKQTTEVVAISEKVLLKHTILMTTLVSPFIVDAVLTSGMSMRQLGNALPSVQVPDVGTGASPVSTKKERHRTWNPEQESTGTNRSPPATFGSLATGSFGRVKGRILHVLPSGSNDAGEKTKLASSMEQFIIGYGMSAGAGANAGSSAPNLHTSSPPPSRGSTSSASTSASNSPLQRGLNSRSPFSSMLPTPSTSRTSTASSVHQVTIATTSASGDLTKPISYVLPASALGEVVYTLKADDHEEHREDGWDVVPSLSHQSRAGSHGKAATVLDCVVSGVLDDAAHTFPTGLGGSGARAWIGGKKDFSVEGAPIESDSLDGIDVDAELQGRTRKRSEMDRARDREKGKEREREKALPAPPATTPPKTRSHTALPQQAESSSSKTQSPSMLVPPPMVRQRAQSQDHSTPRSSHSHRSPQHLAPPTTGTSLLPMDAFQAGYQGGFQAGYQAVKTNASHSPLGEGRASKRHSHQPHQASRSTSQPHPKSQLQPQPQPQYYPQPSPAEAPHSRQANRSRAQSQSTGESYSQRLAMPSINSVIAFPTTASPMKPLGAATWGTGTSSPLRVPSTGQYVASAPPPTPLAGVEAFLQPQPPPQAYVSQPPQPPTDIKGHAESRPAHRPPLVSRDTGLSDTSATTGPSSTSASASGHGSRHAHSDADRGRAGYTHSQSRGESGSAIYVSSSTHKHGRGDVRDGSRDRRTREEERRRGWEGEHRHHRPEEPKYHSSRRSHEEHSRRRESERDKDKDWEKRREEKEIRREERRRREDKGKRREERDKESRHEHRRSDKERVEKDRHMEATRRRHRSASHSHSHSHSVSQTRSTSHHHHHPSEAEVYSSSRRKEEREGKRSPSRPTSTRDVGDGGGLGLPTPPDSSSSTSSCEAGLPNGAVARAEC